MSVEKIRMYLSWHQRLILLVAKTVLASFPTSSLLNLREDKTCLNMRVMWNTTRQTCGIQNKMTRAVTSLSSVHGDHCIFLTTELWPCEKKKKRCSCSVTEDFHFFIFADIYDIRASHNNELKTVVETLSYQTFNDCKRRAMCRVKSHTIQSMTLKIKKQMDCRAELGGPLSCIFRVNDL